MCVTLRLQEFRQAFSLAGGSSPLMSLLPPKLLMSWEDIGADHSGVPATETFGQAFPLLGFASMVVTHAIPQNRFPSAVFSCRALQTTSEQIVQPFSCAGRFTIRFPHPFQCGLWLTENPVTKCVPPCAKGSHSVQLLLPAGACDTLILSHAMKLWIRVGRETWPVSCTACSVPG